ncbi:hypothetical protein [Aeoliella sp. SH292]|uniref:hypothetical protein n=1 Tax=Aeoliella sp. SH292 TaxID=3454464 RepID=UPI003F97BCEA
MGSDVRRSTLLVSVIALSLVAACAWSLWYRWTMENRLATELENLIACQKAARQILELRQQKQRALLKTKPSEELNRKIAAWAQEAGIEAKGIARIEPQEARRVGDSQYLEQVTELEVLSVPLASVIRFAQLAEQSDDSPKLTDLRLSPPRITAEDQAEVWNAEVALTYLIYSPKSSSR